MAPSIKKDCIPHNFSHCFSFSSSLSSSESHARSGNSDFQPSAPHSSANQYETQSITAKHTHTSQNPNKSSLPTTQLLNLRPSRHRSQTSVSTEASTNRKKKVINPILGARIPRTNHASATPPKRSGRGPTSAMRDAIQVPVIAEYFLSALSSGEG